jgi:AcrR family transcriptional regulator
VQAALELFAAQGYERTTVADIAARAGVTERTFFRHFADKREALFDGSSTLQRLVVDAIEATPLGAAPIDVVGAAMQCSGSMLDEERRGWSRQRSAIIAADPALQERELLKLAALGAAAAEALRSRGVPEPAASLAADSGVTAFRIGFERWLADPPSGDLAHCVGEALAQLKAVAAGG